MQEIDEINKYVLHSNVTDKYDMVKTKRNVEALLEEYLRLQYKYLEIIPPRITCNYDVKFNYNIGDKFEKISYYLDKKMSIEKEIKSFYFELQKVLKNMTKEEVAFFNNILLKKQSEESVCESLVLSRNGLKPIKNSCVLKLALAFNLEILK